MTLESMRTWLSGYRSARVAYQLVYGGAVRGRLSVERRALAARFGLRGGVPGAAGRAPAKRGRILAYHSVGTPTWGVNDVSPRDFERHLQLAVDDGWTFATPADVLAEPDKAQLALTFDDGVTSVLTNAVPVLRHHGIPATAFVVTGWADGQHRDGYAYVLDWRGVAALQAAGLTVASHSVTHPDFSRLPAGEVQRELEVSRERLHQMLGVDTDEFAIPFGQSGNWSADAGSAAAEAGYTRIYAQSVNSRPTGTIARTFITRIDRPMLFRAALAGAYDNWEEWY
jgi:peptidoglycan/xylan/chitin deacetylase (PgdA/CDA1 family)